MASTVLHQTMLMLPRNISNSHSNKLGFSTVLNAVSVPRVSISQPHFSSKSQKRSFVVRAEEDAETTPSVIAEENVEESEETVTEVEEGVEEEVEEKLPRKPIVKLGDIMGILNKRAVEASDTERPIPDLRSGDIVEIKLEVPENKRRLSIYKGIVISRQNAGIHTTIRVRRIIAGIGVEIVFPIYSPNIKEIKVVKHRKVRRAKLYYLRDKLPRLSTFK